ncbi:MAG: hypothetical protein AAGC60_16095 [Acidobacteriota bacterium]
MKLTTSLRILCLSLLTACLFGGTAFAAGPETAVDTEPAPAVTSLEIEATGLPEAPIVEVITIPISIQCPDYCTSSNLTYVGPRDCDRNGCLHQCIVYRDNSTGRLCAQRCAAY